MKVIGIVRKLDNLGRVTLPKEWRDQLKLEEREQMEMICYEDHIEIKPYQPKEVKLPWN